MNLKLLIFYISCYLVCPNVGEKFEADYYWLDYKGGPMPANALRLHDDSDVFVGQVYIRNFEVLPASIRTSLPYASSAAYGKEKTSNKHIKVLCSLFLEGFEWVSTNANEYRDVKNIVVGGEEVGQLSHFGRTFVRGKAVLGKIRHGIIYFVNGKRFTSNGPYEVLTYNGPEISNSCLESNSVCPRSIDFF